MKLTKKIKTKAYDEALAHYCLYTKIDDIDRAASAIAEDAIFDLGLHFKLDADDLGNLQGNIKTYIKQHHAVVECVR